MMVLSMRVSLNCSSIEREKTRRAKATLLYMELGDAHLPGCCILIRSGTVVGREFSRLIRSHSVL